MISIFAKPPFWMKHLQRVSSIIRGEQICAYMGNCRLNPPSGYENDTCIYVKPHIKKGTDFKFEKKSWIDIHDGFELVDVLKRHPEVGCISISDQETELLKGIIKNKIVTIPHHHVNYERLVRDRDTIKKVGITGSFAAFQFVPEEIKEGLRERDIQLETWDKFYPRTYVSKFHFSLDIHLQWRPWKKVISSPLKIVNASSFGIPTIALIDDEPSFKEVEGCYIGVHSPKEWLKELDSLMNKDGTTNEKYRKIAQKCLETAEKYHIDNISKLYERLDKL